MDKKDINKFLAYLQGAVFNSPGHHLNIDDAFAYAEAKSGVQMLVGDPHAIMAELGMVPHGNPADGEYYLPQDTPVKDLVEPRLLFPTRANKNGM